jgi:hypothetical protein
MQIVWQDFLHYLLRFEAVAGLAKAKAAPQYFGRNENCKKSSKTICTVQKSTI